VQALLRDQATTSRPVHQVHPSWTVDGGLEGVALRCWSQEHGEEERGRLTFEIPIINAVIFFIPQKHPKITPTFSKIIFLNISATIDNVTIRKILYIKINKISYHFTGKILNIFQKSLFEKRSVYYIIYKSKNKIDKYFCDHRQRDRT